MSAPKKDDQVEHVDLAAYDAWLFDMDGVLTNTASVHAAAWKQAFDEFLTKESTHTGKTYAPFDAEDDYEKYVDGEPRDDGVRKFLAARSITLPEGVDDDPPDARTVKGVGKSKNELFLKALKKDGVKVFDGAVALVKELRHNGAKVAVVSASENTKTALEAAGIIDLFDAIVDGHVVKDLDLKGKPAPDSYLQGAKVLGVEAKSAVVLEDALAGVEAGRAGHFGLVVGVDHHDAPGAHDYADELRDHGADVVVTSLAELVTGATSEIADVSDSSSNVADAVVIFGITGDLAKKMTFQALYQLELAGELDGPIVGVAVDDWSLGHLRSSVLEALESSGEVVKSEVFDRLAQRFRYVQGDFNHRATYEALAMELKKISRPLYYLEIPPGLFAPVVAMLGEADLVRGSRVMIEKPFGHDFASARALNDELHEVLDEDQILRVDHFLGKQPVTDISYLRFANTLFEPVWNRDHVAGVYVTLAENFGVQDRGAFYDPVGALRDVVQNHPFRSWRRSPWRRRSRPDTRPCGTRRSRCSERCRTSTRLPACEVSTTDIWTSRASRKDRRRRPTWRYVSP